MFCVLCVCFVLFLSFLRKKFFYCIIAKTNDPHDVDSKYVVICGWVPISVCHPACNDPSNNWVTFRLIALTLPATMATVAMVAMVAIALISVLNLLHSVTCVTVRRLKQAFVHSFIHSSRGSQGSPWILARFTLHRMSLTTPTNNNDGWCKYW